MMPDISISYHNKEIADEVRAAFNGTPVYCKQSLGYKGSKKQHRKELAKRKFIILIICDDYLKSPDCLAELIEIYQKSERTFKKRIFPIVLTDTPINDIYYHLEHLKGIEQRLKRAEASIRELDKLSNLKGIYEFLDACTDWRRDLSDILNVIGDMNTLTFEQIQGANYDIITRTISEQLHKVKKTKQKKKDGKTSDNNKTNSIEKIYLCNRKDQFTTFTKTTRKKINALYIHGDELHGHDEMFSRFCNHLTGVYTADVSHRSNIKTSDIGFSAITPFNFKTVLSRSFLREFGIKLNQNEISKEEFRAVCKSNEIATLKTDGIVAIHFRIPGGEWFPELINQIEWFVDLCRTTDLPDNAPTFHFFFSVVYSRTNLFKQPILFGKLRRHKKNIIKALEDTSIPSINELSWVKDDHIRHWLSIIGVNDHEKRQRLMAKFFHTKHSRKGFYMSKLKKALTAVINDPQTTEL